jgi:hypothetical protein
MTFSLMQIDNMVIGLGILHQGPALRVSLDRLEDGFKLSENKSRRLKFLELLNILKIILKSYRKKYGDFKWRWEFYNITMEFLVHQNKK